MMALNNRTFLILIVVTIMLLVYVHEHVSIFQVSYLIEKKERELAQLSEDYKKAKFDLTRLRSPNVLKQKLEHSKLDLTTPRAAEIVRVLKPRELDQMVKPDFTIRGQFLSWMSFMRDAHAKMSKE